MKNYDYTEKGIVMSQEIPKEIPELFELDTTELDRTLTELRSTLMHMMVDQRIKDLEQVRQVLAGDDYASGERVAERPNSLQIAGQTTSCQAVPHAS